MKQQKIDLVEMAERALQQTKNEDFPIHEAEKLMEQWTNYEISLEEIRKAIENI